MSVDENKSSTKALDNLDTIEKEIKELDRRLNVVKQKNRTL